MGPDKSESVCEEEEERLIWKVVSGTGVGYSHTNDSFPFELFNTQSIFREVLTGVKGTAEMTVEEALLSSGFI